MQIAESITLGKLSAFHKPPNQYWIQLSWPSVSEDSIRGKAEGMQPADK